MKRAGLYVLALSVMLALPPSGAEATVLARAMSLETTTSKAERIVYGTVDDVRVGIDESGMPATWVTFVVARTLKGRADARVTIKQLGNSAATSGDAIARIPGLPRYTPGEELVVFLRAGSERGFTSPIGFERGVYRVSTKGDRRAARAGTTGEDVHIDRLLARIAELVAGH